MLLLASFSPYSGTHLYANDESFFHAAQVKTLKAIPGLYFTALK